MQNKIKNITPGEFRCGPFGGCPTIFECESGEVIIIGQKLDAEKIRRVLNVKIGGDEEAIIIDRQLLKNIK